MAKMIVCKVKKKTIILVLLVFLLPLVTVFSYQKIQDYNKRRYIRILSEKRKAAWGSFSRQLISEIKKFKGESAIVIKDLESGWGLTYRKDKLFPSASLTKVPIMAASFSAAEQGKISLAQEIALKSSDKLTGSGVLKNMPAGTIFNLEQLIGLMMYDSDNTAANIITNLLGIDYLNKSFKEFGLKNTELSRRIADYKLRNQGIENYTTAEDMAVLLEMIYRGELVSRNVSDKCIGILKLTRTKNRLPKYLPADIMIAHKTGLERSVCHDAGIVFTPKGNFLICVLTRYKNTNLNAAKEFIARMALLTYDFYEK